MPFKDYRITSPFGPRIHPITRQNTFHTGIDLVKSHRAPIFAFTPGEVLFAGMGQTGTGFGGYGNVVAIKDKNNRLHVYAHLDSVTVRKGQNVVQGQEVGKQGNTGQSTGSHLHYEVRKNAQSTPPYGWIADRANNCFEPTQYLHKFYASEAVAGEYIVKAGDTLSKIAKDKNTTVDAIAALNELTNVNLIRVGQVLKIPGDNSPVHYIVKKGDSLSKIARDYQTTVKQLQAWNNISNTNIIHPGQKLRIK